MRRAALMAAVGAFALIVPAFLVPAGAAPLPYRHVSYTSPAGNASVLVVSAPGLDITGATVGWDGTYLRMTASLAAASASAPLPFQEQDFTWRFSVGKSAFYVEYTRWNEFELNAAFSPYVIGATLAGTDTPAATTCATCFATVNLSASRAEFAIGLDDLNSAIDSVDSSAPPIAKGSVLHGFEVDTAAAIPQVAGLPADSAVAPKTLTFTI